MTHVNFFVLLVFISSFLAINVEKKTCLDVQPSKIASFVDSFQPNKTQLNFLPKSTTKAVVFHDFYALSYNEKYEQAEWVAYELKKEQVVNANFKRPYFVQDNKVSTNSADWRNYKRSGYDKGHLCPAADREFNRKAYESTFLTSNISPQKHEFNSGIWNRLEEKIRYWAIKYDGIYVVTAGVLSSNLKTIGEEKVAVPNYFYKIVLDENHGKYRMIAFLMPNDPSNRPLYEFVVSVDKIEQLTGIDFFYQLPDVLENQLEKSSNYKDWSFN